MIGFRYMTFLLVAVIVAAPAFAKNETLAERGKRMCEEAGVPLSECTILPPQERSLGLPRSIANIPPPEPVTPKQYGTGTYGWCADCTSLLAAAPVQPWSSFGGSQFDRRDKNDDTALADAGGSVGGNNDVSGTNDDGGGDDGGNDDDDGGDDDGGGDDCR